MNVISKDGLRYYQFEEFQKFPIVHAFFSRLGGVSAEPFDSLNIGGNLGDQDENIIKNKKKMFNMLNISFESQFDVWQVHGTHVAIPDRPRKPLEPYVQADAIITDKSEFTLLMRFADCVPILLYDPRKHIVGIAHAGWLGTVKNTVNAAVQHMVNMFAVEPADIVAGIGPSIGPDHYTIREDVVMAIKNRFGDNWKKMIQFEDGKIYFNLWKANEINLQESGVGQIEIAKTCTACHTEEWFSHRAESGKTGRFASIIKLLS
ncbi:MAG: peptidoglycan editing factor PgeF [Anaerolineaceae bacterium]|nr:peptidoglycan editing factor PgeF [Anaerolineaceae bacterium]